MCENKLAQCFKASRLQGVRAPIATPTGFVDATVKVALPIVKQAPVKEAAPSIKNATSTVKESTVKVTLAVVSIPPELPTEVHTTVSSSSDFDYSDPWVASYVRGCGPFIPGGSGALGVELTARGVVYSQPLCGSGRVAREVLEVAFDLAHGLLRGADAARLLMRKLHAKFDNNVSFKFPR